MMNGFKRLTYAMAVGTAALFISQVSLAQENTYEFNQGAGAQIATGVNQKRDELVKMFPYNPELFPAAAGVESAPMGAGGFAPPAGAPPGGVPGAAPPTQPTTPPSQPPTGFGGDQGGGDDFGINY